MREMPPGSSFVASDRTTVPKTLKIHDRVSWNSEAGRVSGTIIRVHTRKFEVKGYTHHASPDDPQYEIKSSKTDHIAFHKGAALTKLDD
jgi:Hypervirulence associated proteins TUDOR domain